MARRQVPGILLAALLSLAANAQTDVLVTTNGDRLTGEIKSLDRGMLRFDTDATDTIEVQWAYVAQLTSAQDFLVTLDDGRQIFGGLTDPEIMGNLKLSTERGDLELPALSVVRMNPIEGRLIDRIDMSVDLGYNLSKASNVVQTNLGYDFNYRSEERFLSLDVDATRSSTSNEPVSQRGNASFSYRRFRSDRLWDPVGIGGLERNDELGLDRRVSVGGGMARWLNDTNTNRISFTGGLVANSEDQTDAPETEESIEAAVGITLDWFRYDDPELDVAMNFSVFERLSDSSRTRGNFDVDLRWELISDFFWGLKIYYTFNTEPVGDASRKDYGVVTTVGWSF